MTRHQVLVAGVAALLIVCADARARADAADAPFLWRNSGALTAPAGLPRARDARLPAPGETRFDLVAEIASQYTQDTEADEDVVIDVETTTLLLSFEHGVSADWSARVELPWVSHDGGFLDGIINDYHDLLGLPDGGRKRARDQDVDVRWRDAAGDRVRFTDSARGVGDVRIGFARAFERTRGRATALRLELELPTGDVDDLTGNGGVDVAVSGHITDRRWLASLDGTLHAAGGVLLQLERDQLYDGDGEALVGFANLTLAWPLGARWTIKGQLDAHTATADSALRQVGGWSLQGTLGASFRLSQRLILEAGFAEDLRPGSAPDISILFALRGRY